MKPRRCFCVWCRFSLSPLPLVPTRLVARSLALLSLSLSPSPQAAFAGDDVEAEFATMKAAEVADGLPKVEVDKVLPGWGFPHSLDCSDSPFAPSPLSLQRLCPRPPARPFGRHPRARLLTESSPPALGARAHNPLPPRSLRWGSWASEQKEPRYIREQRRQAERLQKEAAAKRAVRGLPASAQAHSPQSRNLINLPSDALSRPSVTRE